MCPLINEATFNHRSPFSIYKLTRGLPKYIKGMKNKKKKRKKEFSSAAIKKLQTNYKQQQKRHTTATQRQTG